MNPCKDLCYLTGKRYTEECDLMCDYAKAVKALAEIREEISMLNSDVHAMVYGIAVEEAIQSLKQTEESNE